MASEAWSIACPATRQKAARVVHEFTEAPFAAGGAAASRGCRPARAGSAVVEELGGRGGVPASRRRPPRAWAEVVGSVPGWLARAGRPGRAPWRLSARPRAGRIFVSLYLCIRRGLGGLWMADAGRIRLTVPRPLSLDGPGFRCRASSVRVAQRELAVLQDLVGAVAAADRGRRKVVLGGTGAMGAAERVGIEAAVTAWRGFGRWAGGESRGLRTRTAGAGSVAECSALASNCTGRSCSPRRPWPS